MKLVRFWRLHRRRGRLAWLVWITGGMCRGTLQNRRTMRSRKAAAKRNDQPDPGSGTAQQRGGDAAPSPAFVDAIFAIEVFNDEFTFPQNPVIGNQHAGNRSQS